MNNKLSYALLFILFFTFSARTDAQKSQYRSLEEAIYSGRILRGEPGPSNVTWIENGNKYSFTKTNGISQEIWIYEPSSNSEELVFTSADHSFPETEYPFRYRNFQWTNDYRYLLFQTNFHPIWRNSGNADYYYYSIEDKSLELIVKGAFTAEVSPDGKKVGYGKSGDLFEFDFASGKHTRYTDDAEDHFYNGRYGWAYEEEFGLVQAWEWSPDSKYIAYWQSDDREVPIYKLTDFAGKHPEYMEIPYPKVGDPGTVVKIGVIDIGENNKKWLDIDLDGGYIPRVYWTSKNNILAVIWMNRAQNHMKLYFFDVGSGEKSLIMEEQSDTWVDIYDFWNRELHYFQFPRDVEEFFFISERDGYSHIYRFDYSGNVLNQVTKGAWEVIGLKALNSEKKELCYLSTEISPLERNLYRIKFNGKSKKRLTDASGNHSVNISPSTSYFIDSYSDINRPSQIDLRDSNGKLVKKLVSNKSVLDYLEDHVYTYTELFKFTTSDGATIDGSLIRPPDFDPNKSYPLIMAVYGGAGSQGVKNRFGTNSWQQYLAQQGFIIANINNRGNGGYGRDFEKIVYRNLGKWETQDFAEAAEYLSSKPWIDGDRTAIMGHSYGGFSAGYSLVMHPEVFEVGIATAAVENHLLYDCIYAERHMGLLEDNRDGYTQSSISTHAANLKGDLLVVHSLMDDNVHPQNTFQMIRAFLDNGKSVDLKIYPPGNHGVAYDMPSRILLFRDYFDYLNEKLK